MFHKSRALSYSGSLDIEKKYCSTSLQSIREQNICETKNRGQQQVPTYMSPLVVGYRHL
jgi:hypothetical protein